MLDNDNKPQYFITQIVDITERKKSEEQITMLAHSLRSINECVSITDLDDNLIFVNDAFVNMYGYSESELIGNKMSIVRSSNNSPDIVNAILTDTLKGGWSGELWNTRKDGSEFQISLSTTLVKDKTNKVLGLIGIATDITDRKRKELELIGAKEKAEEMNKLKTSFLANMSHELRTPLIGILGYAEFLENDLKDKDQIEMANTIKTSGLRLTTTLNNILDISRIESEKGKMDLKEQDLIKFLTEQIRLFTEPAAEKGLNLTFETKEVHLKAFIDSEMFISTISNLLNNAIKFTQSGKVTLRAMKQENHAVIEVEDTGIGVPVALQEIIFDPFRQASEGQTRSFEGTG
jgi:PAS domain S-box-containing protein